MKWTELFPLRYNISMIRKPDRGKQVSKKYPQVPFSVEITYPEADQLVSVTNDFLFWKTFWYMTFLFSKSGSNYLVKFGIPNMPQSQHIGKNSDDFSVSGQSLL